MKKTAMQQLIQVIEIVIKNSENEITEQVKTATFDEISAMVAAVDLLKTIKDGALSLSMTVENEQLLNAYKEGWEACEKLYFNHVKTIN